MGTAKETNDTCSDENLEKLLDLNQQLMKSTTAARNAFCYNHLIDSDNPWRQQQPALMLCKIQHSAYFSENQTLEKNTEFKAINKKSSQQQISIWRNTHDITIFPGGISEIEIIKKQRTIQITITPEIEAEAEAIETYNLNTNNGAHLDIHFNFYSNIGSAMKLIYELTQKDADVIYYHNNAEQGKHHKLKVETLYDNIAPLRSNYKNCYAPLLACHDTAYFPERATKIRLSNFKISNFKNGYIGDEPFTIELKLNKWDEKWDEITTENISLNTAVLENSFTRRSDPWIIGPEIKHYKTPRTEPGVEILKISAINNYSDKNHFPEACWQYDADHEYIIKLESKIKQTVSALCVCHQPKHWRNAMNNNISWESATGNKIGITPILFKPNANAKCSPPYKKLINCEHEKTNQNLIYNPGSGSARDEYAPASESYENTIYNWCQWQAKPWGDLSTLQFRLQMILKDTLLEGWPEILIEENVDFSWIENDFGVQLVGKVEYKCRGDPEDKHPAHLANFFSWVLNKTWENYAPIPARYYIKLNHAPDWVTTYPRQLASE